MNINTPKPSVRQSYAEKISEVMERIGFDELPDQEKYYDIYNALVIYIADAEMVPPDKSIRINGCWIKADDVRQKYAKLTGEHIAFVAQRFSRATEFIKSPRCYLQTALFNSIADLPVEIAQFVGG